MTSIPKRFIFQQNETKCTMLARNGSLYRFVNCKHSSKHKNIFHSFHPFIQRCALFPLTGVRQRKFKKQRIRIVCVHNVAYCFAQTSPVCFMRVKIKLKCYTMLVLFILVFIIITTSPGFT